MSDGLTKEAAVLKALAAIDAVPDGGWSIETRLVQRVEAAGGGWYWLVRWMQEIGEDRSADTVRTEYERQRAKLDLLASLSASNVADVAGSESAATS